MISNLNIEHVPYDAVRPASWRTTYTFRPEMKLLTQSLIDLGWVQPIVVRRQDATIIDGFARWACAQNDKNIYKRDKKKIPVVWVDCDEVDALIHHVRLNRARGSVVAKPLSKVVSMAIASGKYDQETLRLALGMSADEFDMLRAPHLLVAKNMKEHTYSRAWVPIEAPPVAQVINGRKIKAASMDIEIERPPNPDR
jgi:ParB-like chromosome segregation protein Spo0J